MMTHRPAHARGKTTLGWLDGRHSFSFGGYYDPQHLGHGPLRVINDDRIAPGGGFPMHEHRDMEIVTFVMSGALEHKDSLGHGSVIVPGDVQRMSAGTGIAHSEFNASDKEPARLLQIWITPAAKGVRPSYGQHDFRPRRAPGRLTPLVTPDGADDTIVIHQDARIGVLDLEAGTTFETDVPQGRKGWVQVATGTLRLNGQELVEGDGVAITGPETLRFEGTGASETLVFDLP